MTDLPSTCAGCGAGLGPRDIVCPYCGQKTGILPDELSNDGFSRLPESDLPEAPPAQPSSQSEEVRQMIESLPQTAWLRTGKPQAAFNKIWKYGVILLIVLFFLCISCVMLTILLTARN